MTVDIVGIGDHRSEFKDVDNSRFENSPQQYEKIARRLIGRFASKYSQSLATEMLESDDIVSNVATQLMMADWRWDSGYRSPSDKVRTQRAYRAQCGIWAIYGYIARRKKAKHHYSLSHEFDDSSVMTLHDTLADGKQKEPADILIENEGDTQAKKDVKKLIDEAKLSTKEEIALRLFYMNDDSQVEVARKLGVTRQRAQQLIQNATNKLKKLANADS